LGNAGTDPDVGQITRPDNRPCRNDPRHGLTVAGDGELLAALDLGEEFGEAVQRLMHGNGFHGLTLLI
jgi:hypothetical protein